LFKADYLNLKYLRTSEAGTNASKIANIPEVRDELIKFQRNFSLNDNGSVLDGRDIGTVICPSADIKFFITASLSVRAKRRYEELIKEKNKVSLDEIVADLLSRDDRDSSRKNSPLKISYDAHLIDTTELSIEAAIARAINLVNQKKPNFG
jgi:cytidylate kinase